MRFGAIGLVVMLVGASGSLRAESLQVGSTLLPFSAKDQNDKPHTVDASVRLVVLSADMASGGLVKDALADGGAELLSRAAAVYVADISRMPGLVTTLFALPSLRKRSYPILLDRDGQLTRDWPRSEGKATLIDVRAGGVTGVRSVSSSGELRQALQAAATSNQ